MNKEQFVEALSTLRPSSTFLTLRGYRNEFGELTDFSISFHINYRATLQKSIQQLETMELTTRLEEAARRELLDEFKLALVRMEDRDIRNLRDGYTRFFDEKGNHIKGIKMHNATGALHLYGLVVHKRVREPISYGERHSAPISIAKRKLRALTAAGKFRQFKIYSHRVESITVRNLSLLPPDED